MKRQNKHCVLLTRVSTQVQDYTPQRIDLEKYATDKGFTTCHAIETKESGYKYFDGKQGFSDVVEYIETHPDCRAVFVTEISRLARVQSIIHRIKDWFIENKVQLYIKDINWKLFNEDESGNPTDKDFSADIVFSVFASIAESEMSQKKIRFVRSRKAKQKEGLSHTGKVLFGYRKIPTPRGNALEIVPELKDQIIDMFERYVFGIDGKQVGINGLSMYAVEKGYDKYFRSKRNMNKFLKEKAYTGFKVTNNKYRNPEYWEYGQKNKPTHKESHTEITYPAIISESLFEAVQRQLADNNSNVDRESAHSTVLAKLMKCPACDHYLAGQYQTGRHPTYRCTQRNMLECCPNANKQYSMSILDSVVWEFLKTFGQNIRHAMETLSPKFSTDELKEEIKNLEDRRGELDAKRNVAGDIYTANYNREGAKDKYNDTINKINKEEQEIQKRIKEKEHSISEMENRSSRILEDVNALAQSYENNQESVRKVVSHYVKKVTICYSDNKFYVLLIDSVLYASTLEKEVDNIPSSYYAFIDKHDNNRVKFGFLQKSENVYFQTDHFVFSGFSVCLHDLCNQFYGMKKSTLEKVKHNNAIYKALATDDGNCNVTIEDIREFNEEEQKSMNWLHFHLLENGVQFFDPGMIQVWEYENLERLNIYPPVDKKKRK